MNLLDLETADILSLDGGDVFIGGRYHSLLPILQELYPGNSSYLLLPFVTGDFSFYFMDLFPGDERFYYSVAVIKRGNLTDVSNLYQLRGRKACFPSVGSLAGWIIPIETVKHSSLLWHHQR